MKIKAIVQGLIVFLAGCTAIHKTSDKDYAVIDNQRQLNREYMMQEEPIDPVPTN